MKFYKGKSLLQVAEIITVTVVWLVAFWTPVLSVDNPDVSFLHEMEISLKGLLPFLILFVINHFLLVPKFLFNGKYGIYLASNLVLIALLFLFANDFRGESKFKKFEDDCPPPRPHEEFVDGDKPMIPHHGKPPFRSLSLVISILVVGCDCGVRLAFRYAKIKHDTVQLQKQESENRLSQLKNQISPHFFMNTLNNIHALVDIDPELAKEAIIRLSNLMRYVLYDTSSGMSEISKEIEFLSSYISLMKLRFSDRVKITFDYQDNLPMNLKIPSLIYISMIENAFKHGISYRKSSFVNINLSHNDNKLYFECKNSIVNDKGAETTKSQKGGIGIQNTINRLDLIYGHDNYILEINNDTDNEIYNVKIVIPLI